MALVGRASAPPTSKCCRGWGNHEATGAREGVARGVEKGARRGEGVTQKSVEILIGKLASDEDLRARFRRDRRAAIRSLQREGLELTTLEISSLIAAEAAAFDRLADALDPRLQKASLKPAGRRSPKKENR
jgi:hypothetical protein